MKEKIFEIRIIRSARRTISLEVTRNGEAIVRAPYRMSEEKIAEFTEKHREWLETHLEKRIEESKREELFDADKDKIRFLFLTDLCCIPKKLSTMSLYMSYLIYFIIITGRIFGKR